MKKCDVCRSEERAASIHCSVCGLDVCGRCIADGYNNICSKCVARLSEALRGILVEYDDLVEFCNDKVREERIGDALSDLAFLAFGDSVKERVEVKRHLRRLGVEDFDRDAPIGVLKRLLYKAMADSGA